jgi:hypothetical protein
MNDQLQAALAEMINKSTAGIEKASGFLQAEIPDAVRQLLWWHGIQDFICFCIGVVLSVAWGLGLRLAIKNWDEVAHNDGECGVVMGALVTLPIPLLLMFPLTWLKIWIAPKVWLLDYATSLVK